MKKKRSIGQMQLWPEQPFLIPLEHLRFDPKNPRIAEQAGDSPSQAQLRSLLLASDMQAGDLIPSFIENGYLQYEPMIVRPERGGSFTVLEGNRRLAALQVMRGSTDPVESNAFRKHHLGAIPCIVFSGDESKELAYLGLRHLSKTKDWSTSAKAAFVERVLRSGRNLKEAGRLTNTSPQALRLLLLTRRLFEKAGELGLELPTVGAESEVRFWHLGDAIRRTRTKEYLQIEESDDPLTMPRIDEGRFEHLLSWLYGNPKTRAQRLIQNIRDIPDLDLCLGSRRAAQILEDGGSLVDALEELQAAGTTVAGLVDRAKKLIQRATGLLSDVDEVGRSELSNSISELKNAVRAFEANWDKLQ